MRRTGAGRAAHIEIGIVEITRDDARAETEAAHGIDEQHREIAARAAAARQRLVGRLRTFILPRLVSDLRGDAGAYILEQRQRVGPAARARAGDEALRSFAHSPGTVEIGLQAQRAEIGHLVLAQQEREALGRGGYVEDRPAIDVER